MYLAGVWLLRASGGCQSITHNQLHILTYIKQTPPLLPLFLCAIYELTFIKAPVH